MAVFVAFDPDRRCFIGLLRRLLREGAPPLQLGRWRNTSSPTTRPVDPLLRDNACTDEHRDLPIQ